MKKRQKKLKSDAEVEALLDGDMSDFIMKNKFTKTSFKLVLKNKKIPAHHATFYTDKTMKQLADFDKWMETHTPTNSDIKELRKKLTKK